MRFFADTASIDDIKEVNDLGILDGVTTNPSLMAKEGIKGSKNIIEHYKTISDIVDGHVSAEVIATDISGILKEARELASIADNIVVKVPMIKEGIKAIKKLSSEGIKTNCTLVFSAGQAILAARAGATYVSPFLGRLDDISRDGIDLIDQLVHIFKTYNFSTEILAASIRTPMHIIQCAEIGADVVTCPPDIILKLLNHPLTDIGLDKFLGDYRRSQS